MNIIASMRAKVTERPRNISSFRIEAEANREEMKVRCIIGNTASLQYVAEKQTPGQVIRSKMRGRGTPECRLVSLIAKSSLTLRRTEHARSNRIRVLEDAFPTVESFPLTPTLDLLGWEKDDPCSL